MNTERFNFRVAQKQTDGTYKRYNVTSLGWNARGMYVKTMIPANDTINIVELYIDGDNAILEQCTGVKDHEKNLIYENDIVDMYIPQEDAHRKCFVEYKEDEGTVQWVCCYLEGSRKHRTFGGSFEITAEYLDGSYCRVVGKLNEVAE